MSWIKKLTIIAAVLISCGYIFVFSLSNKQFVDLNLLFITLPHLRIEFVIITTFVLGALLGLLASLGWWLKMRRKYRVLLYKANRQQAIREKKI